MAPSTVPPRPPVAPSTAPVAPSTTPPVSTAPPVAPSTAPVAPSTTPPVVPSTAPVAPSTVPPRPPVTPSTVPPRPPVTPSTAPPRPPVAPSTAPPTPLVTPSTAPPSSPAVPVPASTGAGASAPPPRTGSVVSGELSWAMSAACVALASAVPLMPWSIEPCCWEIAVAVASSLRTLADAAASMGAATLRFAATARSIGRGEIQAQVDVGVHVEQRKNFLVRQGGSALSLDLVHRYALKFVAHGVSSVGRRVLGGCPRPPRPKRPVAACRPPLRGRKTPHRSAPLRGANSISGPICGRGPRAPA